MINVALLALVHLSRWLEVGPQSVKNVSLPFLVIISRLFKLDIFKNQPIDFLTFP
jgi:hypothetical protein